MVGLDTRFPLANNLFGRMRNYLANNCRSHAKIPSLQLILFFHKEHLTQLEEPITKRKERISYFEMSFLTHAKNCTERDENQLLSINGS